MKHTNWYKDAIIYQIYPRSFKDSNNDGFGDIPGIISKLDYLKQLGINCIWLSPVYDSPQEDNGYDIANYYDIYPLFGTLDDMKTLIKKAHEKGIRIIMDLVVNHTSNQHRWFQEALKNKNSPYRNYYIFKKGKNNGKKPPNNWTGFFGGSTWEKENPNSDEYYLHLFAKGQPDLNWENEKVREEVINILRFWLDLGVDGFRCDVITLISKKQDFKNRFPKLALTGKDAYINGPRLHEYLHELYVKAYADYDCMTVGETVLSSLKQAKNLVDPKRQELDMVFNFDHTDTDNYFGVKYLKAKFKVKKLRKVIQRWQDGLYQKGWNSLFIENHDQRRSVGRFGTCDQKYRVESSKMLATFYFFLQGTPFIYQGQEIGTTNAYFKSIDEIKDVEAKNMFNLSQKNKLIGLLIKKYIFEVSRDNARIPMAWDDSSYGGFSSVEPWIRMNSNYEKINVKNAINDSNSVFYYYQKIIEIRKKYPVIKDGKYITILKHSNSIFAYLRKDKKHTLLVLTNFKNKNIKLTKKLNLCDYKLLISNYMENDDNYLKPYEARVYLKEKYESL